MKGGWLPVNPAAAASPPRVPQPDIAPPSPEQLGRILARARTESAELATYLLLSAATGARRSELIALRGRDLDLDDAVVTIARGIVIVSGGLVEKDTKTHSSRRVALDSGTMAAMVEHQKRMTDRANACGYALDGDWFVFTNEADGSIPCFPGSVSRPFKRLCDREGVPNVPLHDLGILLLLSFSAQSSPRLPTRACILFAAPEDGAEPSADDPDASADANSWHAVLAGAIQVEVGEYVRGAGCYAQVRGGFGDGH